MFGIFGRKKTTPLATPSSSIESAVNAAKAKALATSTAQSAMRNGASSVVVLIGWLDGAQHSAFATKHYGRTLECRGLLEHGSEDIRRQLIFPVPPLELK